MHQLKQLSENHPLLFSILITICFILMLVVAAILGNLWPGQEDYGQTGAIAARWVFIALLLAGLAGLGWLRSAGFARIGSWRAWLVFLVLLVYIVPTSNLALTGRLWIQPFNPAIAGGVILFIFTAAAMEEIVFRGLVFRAFLHSEPNSGRALLRAILLSALLFAAIHLFDLLNGRPPVNVLLQTLEAFSLGIILAVLTWMAKSIYPAILLHTLVNISGYLSQSAAGGEAAPSGWLLLATVMLLPALVGLALAFASRPEPSTIRPAIPHE